MTAYIRSGGGKKRAQLERAEAAFMRALAGGELQARLEHLAAKLRTAQLGYLKSPLHEFFGIPNEASRVLYEQYRLTQRRWETMTFEEMCAAYAID